MVKDLYLITGAERVAPSPNSSQYLRDPTIIKTNTYHFDHKVNANAGVHKQESTGERIIAFAHEKYFWSVYCTIKHL